MASVQGVLPVLSTPFDAEWRIAVDRLQHEIEWLLAHGADGVTIAMVSEVLRLSHHERRALADQVLDAVDGRGTVVVSVGAESTDQALGLAQHAISAGADALMANPPLTVQPLPDDQAVAYFAALAEASGETPIIVQDASGYVGAPLSLQAMAELFERFGAAKIAFKPETQPLGSRLSQLHELTNNGARVLEGSGGAALVDNYRRGIVGTMPGPDLVWAVVPLWRALSSGDFETAYRLQERLIPILGLVSGLDSYIAIEKYLLTRVGVFSSERQRQPVAYALDPQTRREVDRLVDRLWQTVRELDSADGRVGPVSSMQRPAKVSSTS